MTLRNRRRAIIGNAGWMMAERILRMVAGVTIGAAVARYLGPDGFGALAYVIAMMAFLQTATSLGLDAILARDLAAHPDFAGSLLGTALRLRLAAAIVCWLLAVALISALKPGDTSALLLTAILASTLFLQPIDLLDLWFQSQTQSRRSAVPRIMALLLASGVRLTMVLQAAPLWAFAAAYLIESALISLLLFASYRGWPVTQGWTWDRARIQPLVKQAWPMLVSGLSIIAYMRIDQLMLGRVMGDGQLGQYAAMLPLSQAWHFIPATLMASAMPYLVQQHAADSSIFIASFKSLLAKIFWLAVAIACGVAASAEQLINLLYGKTFAGAAELLRIHIFTVVPIFLGVAQLSFLTITGRTQIILYQTLSGMAVAVVLNWVLIPSHGASGAAISAVLAQLVSAILVNAILARDVFIMQMTAWLPQQYKSSPAAS